MIINDSNLYGLRKVSAAIFGEELSKLLAMADWSAFTRVIPFSTERLDTGWLGSVPELAIRTGAIAFRSLSAYKYEIEADPFTAGVQIHRYKLEDAQGTPGEVARHIGLDHIMRECAKKASLWYPVQATAALAAGNDTGANSYDGVAMFSAAHPGADANGAAATFSNNDTTGAQNEWFLIDSRAVQPVLFGERKAPTVEPNTGEAWFLDNLFRIKIDARGACKYGEPRGTFRSTANLTIANVRAHMNTMAAYRDDTGSLLGITPDVLVVGRSLRFTADDIVNKPILATGESNDGQRLGLRVVYNPFLA